MARAVWKIRAFALLSFSLSSMKCYIVNVNCLEQKIKKNLKNLKKKKRRKKKHCRCIQNEIQIAWWKDQQLIKRLLKTGLNYVLTGCTVVFRLFADIQYGKISLELFQGKGWGVDRAYYERHHGVVLSTAGLQICGQKNHSDLFKLLFS